MPIYLHKNGMDSLVVVHDLKILKEGSTEPWELCCMWGHIAIVPQVPQIQEFYHRNIFIAYDRWHL